MRIDLAILAAAACWAAACSAELDRPRPADGGALPTIQRTARLVQVEGDVRVKPSGAPDWRPAMLGQELAVNDKLRTQRDSFATIQFEEGGVMRLEPESLVAVTDLRIEQRDQIRRSTFTLMEGRVEAELDSLDQEDSEFKIKTPTAEASLARREVAFQ